jgi:tetraacyldisaccharide 4'-kinase
MRWLEQHWYRISPLHLVLWPLSLLFIALAALRRRLYHAGVLAVTRLPVPVIVVGNISVGGTGKTPLVIWLAQLLRERGYHPGIVCRGYGGSARGPQRATTGSDPSVVGDEAVLLARRCACPVWVGAKRAAAAQALLAAHPECNALISDDGLQHYALARDVEIAVVDGERGFGNGMLLPAGPLREPLRRLDSVDALVVNGTPLFLRETLPSDVPAFDMTLGGRMFYDLLNPAQQAGPEHFARQRVHAVAAIGNPHHFFNHLQQLGLTFTAHPFPDHHAFNASDLAYADADAVLVTEKDAVKCEQFNSGIFWALQVDAEVDLALSELILRKLGRQITNGS